MKFRRDSILIAIALLIAAAGFLVDRTWGWSAFQRSGALIVAFGAGFAGFEIYGMERAVTRHESRVEKLEAAYLDAAKEGRETTSEEAFSRLAANLAEFRTERVDRVGRMIRAEILILCFGTIVWGFGDLVV